MNCELKGWDGVELGEDGVWEVFTLACTHLSRVDLAFGVVHLW